jgi:hypothetical protein
VGRTDRGTVEECGSRIEGDNVLAVTTALRGDANYISLHLVPINCELATKLESDSLPANRARLAAVLRAAKGSACRSMLHLCVDLAYEGSVRRIEPYSLQQTTEGNYLPDAIRSDSGEYRCYRVDRMQGATVTSQVFAPRYAVELTSTAGPSRVEILR